MEPAREPVVSIVIPTFNHADFLAKALSSVMAQEYQDWEIILIDNHSSDHTEEVVNSFKSEKIRMLKIRNNGIIGASRNLGIKNARGEWIAFLDSDDLWYPTRLICCAPFFQNQKLELDIISTNEMMIFSDGSKPKKLRHGPKSNTMYRDLLIYGNRLSPSATLVRKSFLQDNRLLFSENLNYVTAEDYDFWMCLAKHKPAFLFLDNVEGEYFIHGKNMSHKLNVHKMAIEAVLKRHVFDLQHFQQDKDKLWRKVKSRLYFVDAVKEIRKKNFIGALALIYKSVSFSPIGIIDIIVKMILIKGL